jgi:hypothetical protein
MYVVCSTIDFCYHLVHIISLILYTHGVYVVNFYDALVLGSQAQTDLWAA